MDGLGVSRLFLSHRPTQYYIRHALSPKGNEVALQRNTFEKRLPLIMTIVKQNNHKKVNTL